MLLEGDTRVTENGNVVFEASVGERSFVILEF